MSTPTDSLASLAETLEWIRPLARRLGISRVADVTWIDYIGMPVFQAFRPRSRSYTVSQGKGLTPEQAEISAIMESLENLHAEEVPVHVRCSVAEMQGRVSYALTDLARLGAPPAPELIVDWVEALDLRTNRTEYVPRDLVSLDYTVRPEVYSFPFRRTGNGLGSGRTRTEAILHGLHEVLERDCLSRSPQVALSSEGLPPAVRGLTEQVEACGIRVQFHHMPNPLGVPCFKASIIETETSVSFWGSASHCLREVAMVKALTEAVQSRLTLLSGGRDDIHESIFLKFKTPSLAPPPDTTPKPSALEVPERRFASGQQELDWLVEAISREHDSAPLVVNLTRSDMGIPVYFTVIPKLVFTVRGH